MTAEPVVAGAEPTARPSWRSIPPLALVPLAALTWWVVGFLPWLLNGAGHDVLATRGIGTLTLPLHAGGVSALVLGGGLGGVVAGLTGTLGAGSRAVRCGACSAGVAMALALTVVQSRNGIRGAAVDDRITNGLTVVLLVTTIAGVSLGLVGVTGRFGLGLAVGAVAGGAPMWVMSVFNALRLDDSMGELEVAHHVSDWAGALVLAAALVVVGVRTAVHAVIWVAVVLLAWLVAPTITAAGYMEVFLRPGMGLPDMWGDHLAATADVWRMAVSPSARRLTPWIVAIVAAGGVSLWLARWRSALPGQPAQ